MLIPEELACIDIANLITQTVTSHHVTPPPPRRNPSAAGSNPISPPTAAIDNPTPRRETDKSHLSTHKHPRCHTVRARPLRRIWVASQRTVQPAYRPLYRASVDGAREIIARVGVWEWEWARGDGVVFRPGDGDPVGRGLCLSSPPIFMSFLMRYARYLRHSGKGREGGSSPGRSRPNHLYSIRKVTCGASPGGRRQTQRSVLSLSCNSNSFQRGRVEHGREGGRKQTQRSFHAPGSEVHCFRSGTKSSSSILQSGVPGRCENPATRSLLPKSANPLPLLIPNSQRRNSQVEQRNGKYSTVNPPTRPSIPTPSPAASRFAQVGGARALNIQFKGPPPLMGEKFPIPRVQVESSDQCGGKVSGAAGIAWYGTKVVVL